MKQLLSLVIPVVFTIFLMTINACQPKVTDVKSQILDMPCGGDLPSEYVRVGMLTNDEGEDKGEYHDAVKLSYDVFRSCRTLVYDSEYLDGDSSLIIKGDVLLKFLGKMWSVSPGRQQEIVMAYEFDEQGRLTYEERTSVNKSAYSNWHFFETTGAIESEEKIWLHPFRNNQFISLEVAPFPEIEYPIEIGHFWSNEVTMGEGWGEWEHETVYSDYEIVGSGLEIETEYGKISDCWLVRAGSYFKQGRSYLNLYFNPELGFVKFEYINYKNHKISFSLKEVIDQ